MTYIIQTRNEQGLIRTIAKSKDPITQHEILSKYSPGYYCVKETSPRFHVVWKGWIGEPSQRDEVVKRQSREIQALKKKSTYLAWGEAILGLGEVVGFTLTASNFINHGQRINRVESIIATINARNPIGFVCPTCQQPLVDPLDTFCGNCGIKLDWTDARRASKPGSQLCPYCFHPVALGQHFCTQCGKPLNAQTSLGTRLQFVPVRPWSPP